MKIILLILLSTFLSLANSEYPRFKRRGPQQQNGPPRPPSPPQYGKKWGKPPHKLPPQMMHTRPYPGPPPQQVRGGRPKPPMHSTHGMNIPLNSIGHLKKPQSFGGPKFQQYPYQSKPQINSIKPHFKNPVEQHKIPNIPTLPVGLIQFPQESNQIPTIYPKQEKQSFLSSPSIPAAQEYDYHIQTNSIPLNTNPIKQIGEKGPIHTIPAPNLTPADKPSNMQFRKHEHYQQQQEIRYQQPQYVNEQQSVHQYQVTEPSDQAPKQLFADHINQQTHFNQNAGAQQYQHAQPNQQPTNNQLLEQQFLNQQFDQQQQNAAQAQNYQNLHSIYFNQDNPGLTVQDNGNHGINIAFGHAQDDLGGQDMVFSNSKHFTVINDQFSNEDPSQNSQTQAIQSSFAQQQPDLINRYLEDPGFIQQYQHENLQFADDKSLDVQPEYHSFNYDEQAHQAQAKSGHSGYVTATYSLGGSNEIKNQNINSRSSSVDPLTQAEIVQSYFNTRSANTVEPDAKPSAMDSGEKDGLKTPYYTSLPNKEAAERLAQLQAAGKVNSNLMQLGNENRNQNGNDIPTIYVAEQSNHPDEKQDRIDEDGKDQSVEYEDYSQEEQLQSEEKSGYGHKI